jgi:hypothetical protein
LRKKKTKKKLKLGKERKKGGRSPIGKEEEREKGKGEKRQKEAKA